jgi:predicted RNA-binding Zn-ribbon protein involved in translation (DUF1610 family)
MPYKDPRRKLDWERNHRANDPAYAAKCAESRRASHLRSRGETEETLAAKQTEREAEWQARREAKAAAREEARAARLAARLETAARPRKKRAKSAEARKRERTRRAERFATDVDYAERVRAKDREWYAANDERRARKLARQARRRGDRRVAEIGSLASAPTRVKPCRQCGRPIVARLMTAKFCSPECGRAANRQGEKRRRQRQIENDPGYVERRRAAQRARSRAYYHERVKTNPEALERRRASSAASYARRRANQREANACLP